MSRLIDELRFTWLQWLMVAIWGCLILGQLQRWQLTPGVAIYLYDSLVVVMVLALTFKNWKKIRSQLSKVRLSWLLWVGLVLGGLSLGLAAVQGAEIIVALLYVARVAVYGVFIWLSTWYLGWSAQSLAKAWLSVGLGVAYFGLLQYFLLPDTRFLSALGWDDHYFRLVSTWLDPAFTGLVVAITAIALVQFFKTAGRWQKLTLLVSTLLSVTVALTFSRASYLAWLVGWLGTWWLSSKELRKWWVGVGLAWLLAIWLLPKPTGEGVDLTRTSTIQARQSTWQQSLDQLTGVQLLIGRGAFVPLPVVTGTETPATADHGRQADNSILFSILSFGFVGAAVWWLLVSKVLWSSWKVDQVTTVLLAMWLVHSLFNNSLFQPLLFLSLGGVITARWHWVATSKTQQLKT